MGEVRQKFGIASRANPFPRRPELAAALLCAIAALLTLAFILLNGVNVPFADEWWYAGLVKSIATGQMLLNNLILP
jgi:hypothetical protein